MTPILHKPVTYGSDLADWGFLGLIIIHLLPALIALGAGLLALNRPKGKEKHIEWGMVFVWAMIATAVTGILLDAIRLAFFVDENHQKYTDFGMPSTYPARIAFLYAAVCIIYLAKVASHPLNLCRQTNPDIKNRHRWIPVSLFIIGVGLSGLIVTVYNPWTGALWMIWTFMLLVFITGLLPRITPNIADFGVHQHRVSILSLAAFSWWGALQGFGPGLVIAIMGVDNSSTDYEGNLPGDFSLQFLYFLLAWLPFCLIALYLIRHFKRATSS
ncbi:MAG: hypothetical protein KUG76_01880 [Gammaproteobacteria bacterium]|nr:hypothetical protein [Gammaproteobacteria bacterium]